ncbi:bifunctional diaminohydroxyphosphoribosylaminopyrimidine deaminase/5-amino-6-(5-phosphoribosylamino)uracil reductase RibD [Buchnera aphidicola]|uniref:Riboflavin biosynthesis protein RibD n=1 Tax=Buchnera aphidicola (Therioaphis trifolii) TaxID=1241884 RepID=A0A4D6YPP5_9GAMM|nr:bifunctional diaminohydroxyphosphoribosylaminopyrimidine deaminase/5-amino-6-(5-phosphoribosylamino)uracil reductase RibD [Buchnera aphidicola]QCI27285.1 bifunctional diaminohydroxyphosphoribosylaminopyrimidine deaminase/5-amino-6-(5-phosphoribosylamino)uracil reductase RibD [Buchnera aphidicola (Therioaphis trifolii)]
MNILIKKNNIKKSKDKFYMQKAIQLAKKGKYTTDPNPNVGCIIVLKDKIVGIGWHKKSGENHAEVNAINMAGKLSKNATAYISLEPCNYFGKTPPCCDLIIKSGIKRVVIAILDPNPKVSGKSIEYLKKSGIQVEIGILSQKAKNINKGFFKRMLTGIPWIQIKMAISIDGKIAMKNGESKWITEKKSIQNVHKHRALSSAILSTSNTILKDNSKFTARYQTKNKKYIQPIRIIIDSKNRIQLHHKIIQENKSEVWLIRLFKDKIFWPKHVKQIILPNNINQINLHILLKFLGNKKINTLWIECGSNLFSNMLRMHLIDELILYIAPKMLGNKTISLYHDINNIYLNQAEQFIFKSIKKIGSDIKIILQPKYQYKKIS